MSLLTGMMILIAIAPERASYGVLYIENKTDQEMKVTAKVTDEWDVITQTDWEIPAGGAEKIDNIWKLSNIYFKPVIEDDATTADWLKKTTALTLDTHQPAKDLIVTIAKDRYVNKWDVNQLYVSAAKIEYGGTTGYQVKIIAR